MTEQNKEFVDGGSRTKDYVELLLIDLGKNHAFLNDKIERGLPILNTTPYNNLRINYYELLNHIGDTINLEKEYMELPKEPLDCLNRVGEVIKISKSHNIGSIGLKKAVLMPIDQNNTHG